MSLRSKFYKHAVYLPVTGLQAGLVTNQIDTLMKSQSWSPDRIRDLQSHRLQSLLLATIDSVEAYRDFTAPFADRSANPYDFLTTIPPVSKADIQKDPNLYRSTRPLGRTIKKTTGGSTGVPVTILKTRLALLHELAATWRGYSWAGLDMGDPQGRFWGIPRTQKGRLLATLTDLVCHRRRCSAFNFSDQDLADYDRRLKRFRPTWLYGYVSMLSIYADYLEQNNSEPPPGLKAVVTTSELLTPGIRNKLERVFRVRVFNEYGCGEIGTIAHECERGSLHLSDENMIVEIINGDRVCSRGEPGEIVVTELHNLAQPLIRYRMGDHGVISPDSCPCGRGLQVLNSILGRAYDFIVNSEGRRFHGEYLVYLFEELQKRSRGVRQFQIEQKTIDHFIVRIVSHNELTTETREEIIRTIQDEIENQAHIEIDIVTEIPREQSGKIRIIKGLQP